MITKHIRRLAPKLHGVLLLFFLVNTSGYAADWRLGKQLYENGILPNGHLLSATIQGDIRVKGNVLNCASCHRRSGYGDSEGGAYVPPITGPVLFSDYSAKRQHLFRNLYQDFQGPSTRAQIHDRKHRSRYDALSLQRALNQGVNSDGEPLSLQMPRFELNVEDTAHLASYLTKLGSDNTRSLLNKGVNSDTLHFATIYAPNIEPNKLTAVQAVFDAYLQRRNLNVLAAQKKPNYSAAYKSDFVYAQRQWQLHQWHLNGDPESWTKQLEKYYAKQPVFAVLGGIGNDWQPMHKFCEQQMLPCLFPNTPLPYLAETGLYSLYLSRGLQGEAQALSNWLTEQGKLKSLTQVFRSDSIGQHAGQFFSAALTADHSDITLNSLSISASQKVARPFWEKIKSLPAAEPIILWLEEDDLKALPDLPQSTIIASASLLQLRNKPAAHHPPLEKVQLIWPWAIPGAEPKRLYRARAWMRSRNIALTHALEQLNTFFTLNLADYAIHDLIDRFSREYFIEIVERNTENTLNPGLYKHMSLGPEQRIAVRDYSFIKLNKSRPLTSPR